MLVTDVGDKMCWRQLWDVGDGFGRFFTNILYLLTLVSGQQKDVTNFEILSLTSKNNHQDKVTNIHLSPTSMLPKIVMIKSFRQYWFGYQRAFQSSPHMDRAYDEFYFRWWETRYRDRY